MSCLHPLLFGQLGEYTALVMYEMKAINQQTCARKKPNFSTGNLALFETQKLQLIIALHQFVKRKSF